MVAIKKLYYSTDELISRFKPSLSNYFDIFINASFNDKKVTIDNSEINFLAYEAVLPGTSYETTQVFGDRQGLTETFANKRVYPPVDISFYIDYDFKILRYFESWMKNISPNIGAPYQSYQKFKYPEIDGNTGYKKEIIISKFERNFRQPSQRLVQGGIYEMPENWCTYTLRNAYPTNLISVPVSYEGSNILRTTVTFNYDVYSFALGNPYTNSAGPDITSGTATSGTTGSGASNQPAAAPGAANQVRPNSLLTQAEYNEAYARGFAQTFGGADKVPTSFKNPRSQQLLDQYNQTQNK